MMAVKVLLIIGGLNWGLVGFGMFMGENWNVVEMIFGAWPEVLALVYILVGIAALVKIFGCRCKKCREMCAACEVKGGNMGGSSMGGTM